MPFRGLINQVMIQYDVWIKSMGDNGSTLGAFGRTTDKFLEGGHEKTVIPTWPPVRYSVRFEYHRVDHFF